MRILLAFSFALCQLTTVSCLQRCDEEPVIESPNEAESVQDPKDQKTLVFLGDSLTAGYGLAPEEAFPARIEEKIRQEKLPWRVVNSGVSGDTTAGGVSRMQFIVEQKPQLLFLALGANDGLRGISVASTEKNLQQIVDVAKENHIEVILAGMQLPLNYGIKFRNDFARIFESLAKRNGLVFVPFLLEGVAMEAKLNQADGIHPNAEGAQKIANHVWPYLVPRLQENHSQSKD